MVVKSNTGVIAIICTLLIVFSLFTSSILIKPTVLPSDTEIGLVNGTSIDVSIQDQTTRPFDVPVNQILDDTSYSVAVSPTINSYDVTLNTVVGLTTGTKIAFLEQNGMPQIYFGQVMSINGNVVTMNAPVPYNFTPSKASVFTFSNQLNVDGSTDTQVFRIYNSFDRSIDITRFVFKCTDDVEMHDGLFCGIGELSRGVELRKLTNDGYYINYFNIRNNAKWQLIAYDSSYTDKGKPPDDTYGFGSRLTYAGLDKHGVAIRLEMGESIEFLVQDDLTGISGASLMVEGHFTE